MAFSFVNYDGPRLSQDPNVRKLIRRQAMRDAGADRRIRGGYGQHNLRQCPASSESGTDDVNLSLLGETLPDESVYRRNQPSSDIVASDRGTRALQRASQRSTVSRHRTHALPVSVPYLNSASTEKFALLLNLTPLTGLRLGIAKFSYLKSEAVYSGNLPSASNLASRKLAHFIMSRYEQVPILRYATDCVLAKLHQILQPPDGLGNERVLLHYTRALRAVQAALDDEKQRMTAETLCATELLGVFELLNENTKSHSWIHHAGGAAQLIQIRGAHSFQTEFEMALFMAHIGPTVMNAFLSNKPCFLADEGWDRVMRSVIYNDDSSYKQKGLILALWSHLVNAPKKFKDVTDAISSPTPPPQDVIDGIIAHILEDRESLLFWLEIERTLPDLVDGDHERDKYGIIFPRLTLEKGIASPKHVAQLALRGTYVLCRILKSRLLVAMAPHRFRSLETECQHLAARITTLGQSMVENNDNGLLETFFVSQSTWIAKGVVETKDLWSQGLQDCRDGMIEKWKFEAWCTAIGRTPIE
ncbi:hypothetical protein BGZ61DRAFT_440000 [Ilyonectria robusta]|uniref:uncharacterized protein n=1 Tax=Ilyonectria robusta TaxID=1079257 RepID=UPI001E8CC1DB|nr:uncharacterized protein BGZ61DRAFT_440000 [Ilyonectria robusta]KAH8738404.1 hypothetical protein BGZ61DRAFT_440000 [Ilyonectria robusta]